MGKTKIISESKNIGIILPKLGKWIPQKSLILIARNYGSNANKKNKAIIEKYQNLGIVKVLDEGHNMDEYLID